MKNIKRAQRFFQAYATTPWRRQLQVIGLFSAFVIVVALVASAYLWVSSLASTYGRQIQEIQATASLVEENIEDLNVRLSELTTTERMRALAEERGYRHLTSGSLEYLLVPGYPEDQPLVLSRIALSTPAVTRTELPPEFTQSLIDWVRQMLFQLSQGKGGAGTAGGSN